MAEKSKPMTALLNESASTFDTTAYNIPKKLTPMLDITRDFPLDAVHIDPLVALKIVKHAREQMPQTVNGQLLGLQVDNVLEITQCYPVPTQSSSSSDDDDNTAYQVEMLQLLKDVNADTDSVGWYQSTILGNFLQQPFLETQQGYQSSALKSKCVALVLDLAKTERGNLGFKAYRLSDAYLKLSEEANNGSAFTTKKLADAKLTFADVLEELPVHIKNGSLANILMHELERLPPLEDLVENLQRPSSFDARLRAKRHDYLADDSDSVTDMSGLFPSAPHFLAVPNPGSLHLVNTVENLAKPLENMCDVIDEHIQNAGQWMYWQRGAAKEQRRIQAYLNDLKQKSASRIAQGGKPLPEPTEKELAERFRILPEPSRLDALLINAQLHELCQQVSQISGPAVTKLFATQALQQSGDSSGDGSAPISTPTLPNAAASTQSK